MTNTTMVKAASCPNCRLDAAKFRVISQHLTAEDVTTWLRCSCGSLYMIATDPDDGTIMAHGRDCPA